MAEVRIITEPAVYVLGRPAVDRNELARLLADTGFPEWTTDSPCDAQTLVETGARLCYRSFRGGRPHAEHVRHLLEVGHGSCLEHATWTLVVTGISRTCSHELVRHRHLSPSQESQRYVDAGDVAFVVPPKLMMARVVIGGAEEPDGWQYSSGFYVWRRNCEAALLAYGALVESLKAETGGTAQIKTAREAARSVLPGCVETRMQLTGNARSWRSFIEQRATRHADAEIRRLANAVFDRLKAEAPNLFGDYRRVDDELVTEYRKV